MEHPLRNKRLRMLELLNQLLEEARAQHDDMLWLAFYRRNGGDHSRLEVQETEFDVADALNFTGAEAIGILRDLGNDGYVRLQLDAYGFDAGAGLVGVILTQTGLEAIRHSSVERNVEVSKEYLQWERRKKLLRAVHDWYEAQTDIPARLQYPNLIALVEDPAYEGVFTPKGAQNDKTTIDSARTRVMNLFVVLVKDGYIDADISTAIVGLPFTSANVRGLTDKGLQAIGEMPDPNEEIQKTELEKQRQVQEVREEMRAESPDVGESESVPYDVFISHASEDKKAFVEPLATRLLNLGFQVWYDDFTLKVGDSLQKSIDKGIANSKYGIVVLSPALFDKEWTQRELAGLTARAVAGSKKLILPIWHDIGHEEVLRRSPMLADTVALRTSDKSLEEIAEELAEVLRD